MTYGGPAPTCVACADRSPGGRAGPPRLLRVWSTFSEVHRARPVRVVGRERRSDFLSPFVAVEVELGTHDVPGRVVAGLTVGGHTLDGWYDGGRRLAGIDLVDPQGKVTHHRSRRHGRPPTPPDALGVMLTGRQLTVLTRIDGVWTARARVELEHDVDPADVAPHVAWQPRAGDAPSPVASWRSGTTGQLGLRDVHFVANADGSAYLREGLAFLTMTHAGPGFFGTARCGVWSFDPTTYAIEHCSDLWFRRDGVVRGDHATHVVRDADRWLVATSSWATFDHAPEAGRSVDIGLATSEANLLTGEHVLDTAPLGVPTGELPAPVVGTWDPHLTRIDGHWHLAFVAARRFFDFYPALARAEVAGSLDGWRLLGAASDRRATEGTVIARVDDQWRVLASDGPEGRSGQRRRFPVFDLAMDEVGALPAEHPTNIPWPSVLPLDDGGALMVTFDGTPAGGDLCGYGTHGDLVVLRAPAARTTARTNGASGASHLVQPPERQERP